MAATDLVDRLAAHRTIGGAPREELAWLAAHGTLRTIEPGEIVSTKGGTIDSLYVLLEGRMAIFVHRGTARHKAMEWRAGDVAGILPYSRMVNPPGDSIVQERMTVLALHRDHFRELARECHALTSIVVHVMLDRARAFTSSNLHDEKLVSLGKLSAGLAHELNNPAAAIERSATLLLGRLEEAERSAHALGAMRLTDEQLSAIDECRAACLAARPKGIGSPLEQAEREERIADWLADHDLDESLSDALAESGVTLEALGRIAAVVEGPALEAALRGAAAGFAVRAIASDIQLAATRIAGLVLAIKGFTHMDQASVAEPVDLATSLGNTITVLRAKARGKSAAIVVRVEDGLPCVRGFVGELNQVWANLIDNALDAIEPGGRIEVAARRDGESVVVRVVDDGPGIPEAIQARIFDPFFTTKPVGQGTGLGLDIVQRLVRHNDGDIAVESKPGRTAFRVSLPVADEAP